MFRTAFRHGTQGSTSRSRNIKWLDCGDYSSCHSSVTFSRVSSGYKKWSLSITHALIFEPTHTVFHVALSKGSPSILEILRRTQASSGSRSFPLATWPYKLRKFVFIAVLLKQFLCISFTNALTWYGSRFKRACDKNKKCSKTKITLLRTWCCSLLIKEVEIWPAR